MGTQRKQNFRALQAFEAVSRHMSVSAAAVELGVTQSAVSHQIRLLTEEMGERLLQKQGRGVALTAAGDRLATRLQVAFADIARSVMETIGTSRATVRLAVCSSFAPGWLIPRLSRLYAQNPAFDLQLCMYARDPVLTDTVADAFITSMTQESGFYSVPLKKENLVPVAAPANVARFGCDLPLITTDMDLPEIGTDWETYRHLSGGKLDLPADGRWLFASHYVTALAMARAGLGAALVPDFLAESHVAGGELTLLDEVMLPTGHDYYLYIKESRRSEPSLDALCRWFRAENARDNAANGAAHAAMHGAANGKA